MYRSLPGQSRDRSRDRAVATAIAPRFLLSRRILDASIETDHEISDAYTRAGFRIERREPTLRWAPASGTSRDRQGPPNPATFDPWAQSPEAAPGLTRRTTACFSCDGAATVSCGACRGTMRVACSGCGGSGRVHGKRAMKNCPSCRAGGTQKCGGCTHGRVPCRPCAASGSIDAWLEIVVTASTQVQVLGDGPASRVHALLRHYADFDAGQWPNQLLDEQRAQGLAANLPAQLQPTLEARTERVLDTRIQRFGGQASVFTYRTAFGQGSIHVAGNVAQVASSSELGPLGRRRALTVASLALLGGASFATWTSYLARHPWFYAHGTGTWVLAASAVAAVAATWMLSTLLLAAKPRRLARPWLGAVAAALAIGGTVLSWRAVRPELAQARAYLAANQLDAATAEARAVGELGLDAEGAKVVMDEAHLRRFELVATMEDKAAVAAEGWYLPAARQVAIDRLLPELDARAASVARSATGLRAVAKLVPAFDPKRAQTWNGQADLLDADAALAHSDWSTATEKITAASTKLGPDAVVEAARRVDGALEADVRREVVSTRAVRDPTARQPKWRTLDGYRGMLATLRTMARVMPAADWAALETTMKNEGARADREVAVIEAARRKQEALEAQRAAAKRAAEERAEASARAARAASYTSYSGGGGGGGGCRRGYTNKNGVYHCTLH